MIEAWRFGVLLSRPGVTDLNGTGHDRGTALAVAVGEMNRLGSALGWPLDPVCSEAGAMPEPDRARSTPGSRTAAGDRNVHRG